MVTRPVWIGGEWRDADAIETFLAENPATREPILDSYPVSSWKDCDDALDAAAEAAEALRGTPTDRIADFLDNYAERIEQRSDELIEIAHAETALPISPRLADVELPRTTNQLRQAAAAARDGSWVTPTIDTKTNIRSCYGSIGPVCVFGPNNFPFAFGSVSGGDFAAAIAAGNPVLAKANPLHPGTTRLLAECSHAALQAAELPSATVQLIYRISHVDGERLVADSRIGATGYTGSRSAGLRLKAVADAAGKPIYLELSSTNPVIVLPGALEERCQVIAEEFATSCLMGTGQFCTSPGLMILVNSQITDDFIATVAERFRRAPVGTLLSKAGQNQLVRSLATLQEAGARPLTDSESGGGPGYSHANTLLTVTGKQFLKRSSALQTEAFGNASVLVVTDDVDQACEVVAQLEGNLTGCIYSHTGDQDEQAYERLAPHLRRRVGRLLNDKMPTGVAVSPAMNHGGPFPATGHPGFTAVGIPGSLRRFAALECYDNVRPHRLPACLQDENPTGALWRSIDGQWSQANVSA